MYVYLTSMICMLSDSMPLICGTPKQKPPTFYLIMTFPALAGVFHLKIDSRKHSTDILPPPTFLKREVFKHGDTPSYHLFS